MMLMNIVDTEKQSSTEKDEWRQFYPVVCKKYVEKRKLKWGKVQRCPEMNSFRKQTKSWKWNKYNCYCCWRHCWLWEVLLTQVVIFIYASLF